MVKKIVLLADGTGKAFLTQESNIWRIYRALDLSDKDQVACYIEGVGTSKFWPLAVFDGATGFGVPENIRKLYRFLCWNYEPDAEIYMFGFSRGAFTIRALIGLIASEGLIARDQADGPISHEHMQNFTSIAYGEYRFKSFEAMKFYETPPAVYVARGWRALKRAVSRALKRADSRARYDKIKKFKAPEVAFVGLFDTVEAFGVPIEEMRTAIDQLIWPISFRNEVMSGIVQNARHALSLDDERTTFRPLRITPGPSSVPEKPTNLKEVWFAGVHSDVGGGYPDGALSFVSLNWILDELKRATSGLKCKPRAVGDFRDDASSFGLLHDSREGIGVFYRYDPRSTGDPAATHGETVVHHSVVERMVLGSDNYAPIALASVDALVALPSGETRPIFEKQSLGAELPRFQDDVAVYAALRKISRPDQAFIDYARDLIWWRRCAYFVLVFLFAVVALSPWTADWITDQIGIGLPGVIEQFVNGVTFVIAEFVGFFKEKLPSFATMHLETFGRHPLYLSVLVGLILGMLRVSDWLRNEILYASRRAWSFADRHVPKLAQARKKPAEGRIEAVRDGSAAGPQGTFWTRLARNIRTWAFFSPQAEPCRAQIAFAMWFLLLAVPGLSILATLASRAMFNVREAELCSGHSPENWDWVDASRPLVAKTGFVTNSPCWASGVAVEKETAYRLTVEIVEPWFDGTMMTDVGGYWPLSWMEHYLTTPLLRWPGAGAFQPIGRVGAKGNVEWPLVSADRAGPLQSSGTKCTAMPMRYEETAVYCKARGHAREKCREAPVRFRDDGQDVALSFLDPLPAGEMEWATRAWNESIGVYTENGRTFACASMHPRKVFASDFVAPETGELFLFVNDMIPLLGLGGASVHYRNNLGAAKITLQRAPPAESGTK